MPCTVDNSTFIKFCKMLTIKIFERRGVYSVIFALKYNARNSDVRLQRKTIFDVIINGITRDPAEAVAVRMQNNIDKIGIIERRGSCVPD